MTAPNFPHGVSTTVSVDPSPAPHMTRSMAVGISLRCLPRYSPSGPKNTTVQYKVPRSPLDDSGDQIQSILARHLRDELHLRPGNGDRTFKIPPKLLPPVGRTPSDNHAKITPLGIPANERLRKQHNLSPGLPRRLGQLGKFFERPPRIEQHGPGLYHADHDRTAVRIVHRMFSLFSLQGGLILKPKSERSPGLG